PDTGTVAGGLADMDGGFRTTILVLPESADSGELIRVMLDAPDRHVLVANRTADTLDLGRTVALELLICELSPPLLHRIETVARLRELQPTVGVLFVSAWHDHPGFPELREPLLRKPFSDDQLLSAVTAVLERASDAA